MIGIYNMLVSYLLRHERFIGTIIRLDDDPRNLMSSPNFAENE